MTNLITFRDKAIKHNSKVDMVNVSADDLDVIIKYMEVYHTMGNKIAQGFDDWKRFCKLIDKYPNDDYGELLIKLENKNNE